MNVEDTLAERHTQYGAYSGVSALSQVLKDTIHNHRNWQNLTSSQQESLEMIMHKTARILNGDPNHKDGWTDISGYATLITKQLEGLDP